MFNNIEFSENVLIRGNDLHDRIISLRGEVYVHKANLTPPLYLSSRISPGKWGVMHLC